MMKKRLFMLFAGFLLAVMGCSQGENIKTDEAIQSADSTAENEVYVLVDDLGNEVTIPSAPQRIIAPYLEDELLTLDMMPIAQWSVHDSASIQEYLQDQLKDIPTIPHDVPFEVVSGFNPDLLILSSAGLVEGGKYETYSKIAPTFVIESEKHNDWRQRLIRVSEVFGKEEAAEKKLAEYDQLVEDNKSKIKEAIGDESVAVVWVFNDDFYIVNQQKSSGTVLYHDLDLTIPDVVMEISENANDDRLSISLERLAELDADHLFLIVNQIGEGEKALKDHVFQNIPAVKHGHVYEYTSDSSWLYSGYIANTQIVQDVSESLLKDKK